MGSRKGAEVSVGLNMVPILSWLILPVNGAIKPV